MAMRSFFVIAYYFNFVHTGEINICLKSDIKDLPENCKLFTFLNIVYS